MQPVSGLGLVGLAVYSHFVLRERLQAWEWWAAALSVLGTILLGASSPPASPPPPLPPLIRALPALALLTALALSPTLLAALSRRPHRLRPSSSGASLGPSQPPPGSAPQTQGHAESRGILASASSSQLHATASALHASSGAALGGGGAFHAASTPPLPSILPPPSAAVTGLQAGACFGLSAGYFRAGFLLHAAHGAAAPALGLACGLACSSAGFFLQTLALKEGRALVVCVCAAVAAMVAGVVEGVAALGEPLPATPAVALLQALAWVLMLAGVAALAGGPGGAREALALLASRGWLPRRARGWAVRTGKILPDHHAPAKSAVA